MHTPNAPLNTGEKLRKASTRLRLLEESKLSFTDAKSFYTYANKRLKGKTPIPALRSKSKLVAENAQKADLFAEYFSSVYKKTEKLENISLDERSQLNEYSQSFRLSREKIIEKIRTLPAKCSYTPDAIPPMFYRNTCDFICDPLFLIFERSFNDAVLPKFFLRSIVTPVFKKGLKESIENYRPIAQLSVACILFEKILVDHIEEKMSTLFDTDTAQHGFTKGKSTATQLVTVIHDWGIYLNRKSVIHCIYFDFKKAFDTVNHKILLEKLLTFRLDLKTVRWIRSYLTGRTFSVKVENSCSAYLPCSSGVPQGSCLGPLLFKIFLLDIGNELPSSVTHKLFADDLKIYCEIKRQSDVDILQEAINKISNWCSRNDMVLSASKCVLMTSDGSKPKYILNDVYIPVVDSYRDLGVLINPKLDFSEHISSVISSTSQLCNMIFRCFIIKRPEFYIKLFKSLVLPKMLYCSPVWRPYLQKDISALEGVQNKFIRRVAKRCNVPRDHIHLDSIFKIHNDADLRLFYKLGSLDLDSTLFDFILTSSRTNSKVRTLEVARSEHINNLFSRRIPRFLRNNPLS